MEDEKNAPQIAMAEQPTIMDLLINEVSEQELKIRKAVQVKRLSAKAGEMLLSKVVEGLVVAQLQSMVEANAQAREQEQKAMIEVPKRPLIIKSN